MRVLQSASHFAAAACRTTETDETRWASQRRLNQILLNAETVTLWTGTFPKIVSLPTRGLLACLVSTLRELAKGSPIAGLLHGIHAEDRDRVRQQIAIAMQTDAAVASEYRPQSDEGKMPYFSHAGNANDRQTEPDSVFRANRRTKSAAETGNSAALPMGGKKPLRLAAEENWIRERVREKSHITGRELPSDPSRGRQAIPSAAIQP